MKKLVAVTAFALCTCSSMESPVELEQPGYHRFCK